MDSVMGVGHGPRFAPRLVWAFQTENSENRGTISESAIIPFRPWFTTLGDHRVHLLFQDPGRLPATLCDRASLRCPR